MAVATLTTSRFAVAVTNPRSASVSSSSYSSMAASVPDDMPPLTGPLSGPSSMTWRRQCLLRIGSLSTPPAYARNPHDLNWCRPAPCYEVYLYVSPYNGIACRIHFTHKLALAITSCLLSINLTASTSFVTHKESGVLSPNFPDVNNSVPPSSELKREVLCYVVGSGVPEIKTILDVGWACQARHILIVVYALKRSGRTL